MGKIVPIENPAIESAVEEFHKAVTEQECFAITAMWNLDGDGSRHANFTSGLIGSESFKWGIAQAIYVAAQKYECEPEEFADEIKEFVTALNEPEEYEENDFESAVENLKGVIDCYERFRRDSIPNNKTFYSDFEEEAYNKYYAKTCEEYEADIAKAARKVMETRKNET